jgi:hypothetical protein
MSLVTPPNSNGWTIPLTRLGKGYLKHLQDQVFCIPRSNKKREGKNKLVTLLFVAINFTKFKILKFLTCTGKELTLFTKNLNILNTKNVN